MYCDGVVGVYDVVGGQVQFFDVVVCCYLVVFGCDCYEVIGILDVVDGFWYVGVYGFVLQQDCVVDVEFDQLGVCYWFVCFLVSGWIIFSLLRQGWRILGMCIELLVCWCVLSSVMI